MDLLLRRRARPTRYTLALSSSLYCMRIIVFYFPLEFPKINHKSLKNSNEKVNLNINLQIKGCNYYLFVSKTFQSKVNIYFCVTYFSIFMLVSLLSCNSSWQLITVGWTVQKTIWYLLSVCLAIMTLFSSKMITTHSLFWIITVFTLSLLLRRSRSFLSIF
jgi:hypothetical protein